MRGASGLDQAWGGAVDGGRGGARAGGGGLACGGMKVWTLAMTMAGAGAERGGGGSAPANGITQAAQSAPLA